MRILITGGAGFMGSHLVDACLAAGHRVAALDDLSSGSLGNLASAVKHPAFRFVQGDVLDEDLVDSLVGESDRVHHLAAAVGVRMVVESPVRTMTVNSSGAKVVIEACARHGAHLALASTSEVYGRNPRPVFSEGDDLVLGPSSVGRWSYACAKALDEFMAFGCGKEQGLRFVILRHFNTVGPRQVAEHGMVLPRFLRQAMEGKPLTVFGDGLQTRCFIHVADAVEATLRLADRPSAAGEVVNVGNPAVVSILDLAQRVIRITGSPSRIEPVDPRTVYDRDFDDMAARVPDIAKLQRLTGFTPGRTLDDAIRDAWHWMKNSA